MYNKKNTAKFVTSCHSVNNVLFKIMGNHKISD